MGEAFDAKDLPKTVGHFVNFETARLWMGAKPGNLAACDKLQGYFRVGQNRKYEFVQAATYEWVEYPIPAKLMQEAKWVIYADGPEDFSQITKQKALECGLWDDSAEDLLRQMLGERLAKAPQADPLPTVLGFSPRRMRFDENTILVIEFPKGITLTECQRKDTLKRFTEYFVLEPKPKVVILEDGVKLAEMQKPGLTDGEKEVLRDLVSAWNKFADLNLGGDWQDGTEFCNAIRVCQQIVGLRVAKRVDPDFWSTEGAAKEMVKG